MPLLDGKALGMFDGEGDVVHRYVGELAGQFPEAVHIVGWHIDQDEQNFDIDIPVRLADTQQCHGQVLKDVTVESKDLACMLGFPLQFQADFAATGISFASGLLFLAQPIHQPHEAQAEVVRAKLFGVDPDPKRSSAGGARIRIFPRLPQCFPRIEPQRTTPVWSSITLSRTPPRL